MRGQLTRERLLPGDASCGKALRFRGDNFDDHLQVNASAGERGDLPYAHASSMSGGNDRLTCLHCSWCLLQVLTWERRSRSRSGCFSQLLVIALLPMCVLCFAVLGSFCADSLAWMEL